MKFGKCAVSVVLSALGIVLSASAQEHPDPLTPSDIAQPPVWQLSDSPGTGEGDQGSTEQESELVKTDKQLTPKEQLKKQEADKKKKDEEKKKEEKKKEEEKKKKEKQKKKQEELAKLVAGAHKPVFYDNDFKYVTDPDYNGWQLGDNLKRRSPVGKTMLDLGGQYRMRMQDEQNIRGLGLTGRDDDFLLQRLRLFANWELTDRIRIFAEYLDAVSTNEQFLPRLIEENRSDMLNLFADAVLIDGERGKLIARSGRQELLYADERLISPLDWANIRRTFDGSRLMWKTEKFQSDLFWVRPLLIDSSQFDSPDRNLQLYGTFAAYKSSPDKELDAFYLAFDDDVTGTRFDSLGGRVLEAYGDWLFELWGNYQFGTNADDSAHNAGAWTVGFGRILPGEWKPRLWLYYDWASGSDQLASGNGYFQFFPLAHRYLGFMDLFGRRNIESPNVLLTMQPSKKLQLLVWYYYMFLENVNDTPYSVVMTPFASRVTPGSAELGHELDFLATYSLGPRSNIVAGYSHFFSGAYYDTPGLPFSGDGDFFYLQYLLNF
jgi:hypothetical protein